ncbi:MAG: efflux RND transporter periplasmic adaptor subunit, partial [Candidatus Aminicenantes bacterium]|nr:efflux RND transporter periplasmic adaptor subunit [Candidatus Aminicenantes bacterium]
MIEATGKKRNKTMKISKAMIFVMGVTLLFACRPNNKQAELARLERQRNSLNQQIEQLKAEIAQQGAPAQRAEPLTFVSIAAVNPDLFKHYIQVQGTVESDNNILIPAQSSGVVKKIHVKEGDRARQGQLLAELDGSILESSIAELENGLELATTIYERQERLRKKNIGSEIQYLQARNNKEGLEKKLETLQWQYRLTKIHSPINGTVDDVLIKEGEMAAAGFGTIRVVQLSRLKVTANLSENYISRVKRKDMVKIEIPVAGVELEHTIVAVAQVIDPDNRTFKIEINLPASEKNIKPNMLAVVTINDYTNPEALTVPQNIIQKTGTENFLFVAIQENGRWVASRRAVQTGESYNNWVEILTGLEPGDQVVIFGFQNLADKQAI